MGLSQLRVLVSTIPFGLRDETPLRLLADAGAEVVINPLGRKFTEQDLVGLISDFIFIRKITIYSI